MGAVDVGVGHDDDPAVAQPGAVEAVAGAAAQGLDQVLQLLVLQQLLVTGAGDVEDLAAQRQDGLGVAVARLLGRAAGAVALDEEDLGVVAAFAGAVGELAGQAQAPGGGLARNVLGFTAAQALLGALDDEGEQVVGLRRVAGEPVVEPVAQRELDQAGGFRAGQLLLGLALELRVADEGRQLRGHLAEQVLGGDLRGALVAALLAPGAQAFEQRGTKAGLVRAALRGGDGVAVGMQQAVGGFEPGDRPFDPAADPAIAVGREVGLARPDFRDGEGVVADVLGEAVAQAAGEVQDGVGGDVGAADQRRVAGPADRTPRNR